MKTIQIFQPLRASPARLFRAITDPGALSAWQADVVKGRVEPGGRLDLSWPRLGIGMTLEVVEVTPMRRVVLEHETGRLELQIVRGGLSLQHRAAFDDDQALGTESSWRIALAMLGEYLDHHAGSTRRVHWAMTRGRADAALCHAYFTEPELLASWLGPVEGVGTTGSIVRFRFPGNRPASGVVLANTPGRDVAFSWREADQSVLVLRTLPLPAEPGARLALLGWSRWNDPPNARAVCQELDTAAERLGRWLERVACA